MKVIGLTGGIGIGKSSAARVLARDGVYVLDAEQLNREVTDYGTPGFHEVVCTFGRMFLNEAGRLDRGRLSNFCYVNPERRAALDAILVPLVNKLVHDRVARLSKEGVLAVLYEDAILFETERDKNVDGTILIAASVEAQRERLIKRDRLTRLEADRRMSLQMPLLQRINRASMVVENNGTVQELERKIRTAWGRLVGGLA